MGVLSGFRNPCQPTNICCGCTCMCLQKSERENIASQIYHNLILNNLSEPGGPMLSGPMLSGTICANMRT